MRLNGFAALAAIVLASCSTTATTPATDTASMTSEDPYLWLEEVEGERALAWVREQNQRSLAVLEGDPRFAQLHRGRGRAGEQP